MKYLLLGGNGLLGKELQAILTAERVDFDAPSHTELDVCNRSALRSRLDQKKYYWVIHAAAYTDVAKAEQERALCYQINVEGTRNVAQLARQYCKGFTYMSTDYVFDGEKGSYSISDTPHPTNFYALTKLLGEEICRTIGNSQVIRTSFKPSEWEYPKAFVDQWTSADYVDKIALLIWKAIKLEERGVLHIGTEKKTVFELARRRNPEVGEISVDEVAVMLPRDISLKVVGYGR